MLRTQDYPKHLEGERVVLDHISNALTIVNMSESFAYVLEAI